MEQKNYLTVEDLKDELVCLETDGADYLASGDYSGIIDDAIRETADNSCIYYRDTLDWFENHFDEVDDYVAECGSTGSVMSDIQNAQYMSIVEALNSELDDIINNYIINYLVENDKKVTQEKLEDILTYDLPSSFDRFDDIDDYIEDELWEDEDEDEEDEEGE